ncbi:MAG: hypothetical protein NT080_02075 [Spirochaetes bacterium]|nr:hypothetical protein [Spirochaetota bacterium]
MKARGRKCLFFAPGEAREIRESGQYRLSIWYQYTNYGQDGETGVLRRLPEREGRMAREADVEHVPGADAQAGVDGEEMPTA